MNLLSRFYAWLTEPMIPHWKVTFTARNGSTSEPVLVDDPAAASRLLEIGRTSGQWTAGRVTFGAYVVEWFDLGGGPQGTAAA